jgi:hypothetical protein
VNATGNGAGDGRTDVQDGLDSRLEESLSAIAAATASAPPMSEELAREIGDLEPVRTRAPLRQSAVVLGLSMLCGGGILALFGMRHDLEELPRAWLFGVGALWLASYGSITWMVLVPPRDQVMPRWRWAAALSGAAAAVFIAGGLLRPESVAAVGSAYDLSMTGWFARGRGCLGLGLTVAALPVAFTAVAVRGAVPVGSRWAAAAIGAAGGSLGGLMLHLHCPIGERFHVGLAHGGTVLVAAALAALVVPVGERRGRRSPSSDSNGTTSSKATGRAPTS